MLTELLDRYRERCMDTALSVKNWSNSDAASEVRVKVAKSREIAARHNVEAHVAELSAERDALRARLNRLEEWENSPDGPRRRR